MSKTTFRSVPGLLLFGMLSVGGIALGAGTAVGAEDDACTTKNFKFDAVKKACEKGGRAEAKKLMKDVVKKAKDAGQDVKCTNCHEDLKAFDLKANAVGDLKKLM